MTNENSLTISFILLSVLKDLQFQASPVRKATPPPRRLCVRNLSRNVTKEHLSEIFSVYGTLKTCELPMDRQHTHLGRGFCFFSFTSQLTFLAKLLQVQNYTRCSSVAFWVLLLVLIHPFEGRVPHQDVSCSFVLTLSVRNVPRTFFP